MTKNLMPLEQVIMNLGQELLTGLLEIPGLLALSWKLIQWSIAHEQPHLKHIRRCALACLTLASRLSHSDGKA